MGAQSPPMMTSPHGYSEVLKRNLQVGFSILEFIKLHYF